MRWIVSLRHLLLLGAALGLAAGSGFLASTAISAGSQAAVRTTTISLTNGSQGPAGPPGPPGPAGAGLTPKGSVASVGDLPATGNQKGDTYIVTANSSIQVWDGTKWVPSGSVALLGCPEGFSPGELVIDHPGGHVTLYTCLQD